MSISKYYAGIDLHKNYAYLTIMNDQGYIQEQGTYHNRKADLVSVLLKYQQKAKVEAAVESTYGWYWLGDKLEESGINYHLTHPQKIKAIAGSKKTDKVDAKILADLLRTNLLPMAYVTSAEERQTKQLLRLRFQLVEQKSTAKRRLRDLLAKQNLDCPYKDISGSGARNWFANQQFPFPYNTGIKTLLTQISQLEEHISDYDVQLDHRLSHHPNAELLQSIPGIGLILGMTIAVEIGDVYRFPNSRSLCSYAGIVPSVSSSGGKTHYGSVSRYGNPSLRWALAEAVPHVVKKDAIFGEFYDRLGQSKPKPKVKFAVMNKLMRAIYVMLTKQVPFQIQEVKATE